MVIRRTYEEGQRLLLPHYSLILISRDDLPLADLVGRHRAKPGPQSACKGPPRELNLDRPPCKFRALNQSNLPVRAVGAPPAALSPAMGAGTTPDGFVIHWMTPAGVSRCFH